MFDTFFTRSSRRTARWPVAAFASFMAVAIVLAAVPLRAVSYLVCFFRGLVLYQKLESGTCPDQ